MSKKITLLMLLIAASFGVIYAQPAAPTITGNTNYCQGQTITLTASSPAPAPVYTWTGPGIVGSYTGATYTAPATVPTTSTYKVTVTSGGLTSAAASITITVNLKPAMPFVSIDSLNYCQQDKAAMLTAIGANLLWYTSAVGGVGNSVAPTPSTSIVGVTYYYVTQTVNGCESDRKPIAVNVKAKPAAPIVSDVTYCQNAQSLPLTAGGTNLRWYLGSTGGFGSPVSPLPGTAYAGIQYFYVTQTLNGCESDRSQVKVKVNYTPNGIIVSEAPYVCQYDSLKLSYFGNAKSTAAFDWSFPNGTSLTSGSGAGPVSVKYDVPGQQTVSLVVEDNGCKSNIINYTVKVNQLPVVPLNVPRDACQGQIVNITSGFANEQIDNYSWDFGGANVQFGSSGPGPYGIVWNTSGLHTISMTATALGCPSVTTVDTVFVHTIADAHIASVSDNNICAGDSVSFTAERYNPAYLYQWLPGAYFGTQTNKGTVYGFITNGSVVTLKVTTEYGCTSQDSVIINTKPCCDVFFPDAFTPNGDGKNDYFRPITQGNQQIKLFTIVNRWGQVVYESVDARQGWDGRVNGQLQDMGTYMYMIRYVCANGRTYEKKGELILVR